jgi:hypothetical protein
MEGLEERALRQFDSLVKRGSLHWEATTGRLVSDAPFNVGESPFFFLTRIAYDCFPEPSLTLIYSNSDCITVSIPLSD